MNRKTIVPAFLLASLLPMVAEEAQTEFDASAPVKASTEWKPNPALRRDLLHIKRDHPTVTIGRTEFQVGGPLVETLRRPRNWSDLSLGRKLLALPVINLFVPQPMPSPPGGGGKYFAWGDASKSWTSVTGGAYPGNGRSITADNHEPTGLIYFGW